MREQGGSCNNKVVHINIQLLYLLATSLAICDVATSYSQQPAILLTMLLVNDMWTLNAAGPHVILMVVVWFATHSFEMNRPVVAWPWQGCHSWASGSYEA